MASSSAHLDHHQLPNLNGGATAAPPPTPSCTNTTSKSETAADALSRLFHRMPPNLSLPNRRSSVVPSSTAASLPTVTFSPESRDDLITAATELGYFQLVSDTIIPSGLAEAAESDTISLLELSEEKKESSFPKNWPLGYEADAESPFFCLDADCTTESSELNLSSLHEFTKSLEEVGLKTVEILASALGFKNPFGNDSNRFSTLMWINHGVPDNKPAITNGFYPFVVCLQYQIREQKYCLLSESGWVSVSPRVDSVLVTLGDVAQMTEEIRARGPKSSSVNSLPPKLDIEDFKDDVSFDALFGNLVNDLLPSFLFLKDKKGAPKNQVVFEVNCSGEICREE